MSKVTLHEAIALAEIIGWAQRTERVARVMPGMEILNGTARSIGDQNGNFLLDDEDVRDGFLRVTTESGFEVFWPVADLVPEVRSGEFTAYDWRRRSPTLAATENLRDAKAAEAKAIAAREAAERILLRVGGEA